MIREVACVLLFGVLVLAGCSSNSSDAAAWCSAYGDLALAAADYEAATEGSSARSVAAADYDTAILAMAEAGVPEEIVKDFAVVTAGRDPTDAGAAWSQAIERVNNWLIENCDFHPDLIELLESE